MGNRLDTVEYSSVRMILREISEPCADDAVYGLRAFGQSRLQEHHSYVLEDVMAFRQTGETLAFTINSFGPSAGRISRYRKDT